MSRLVTAGKVSLWSTTKDTSERVDSGELPADVLSGLTAKERGILDSLTI